MADAPDVRPLVIQIDDNEGDLDLGRLAVEDCCGSTVDYRGLADAPRALQMLATLAAPGAPTILLIIVDVNLPRVDGWEVVKFIQADPVLRLVPLIVMSGSSSARDLGRARAAAVAYRVKPTSFTALSKIIRDVIGARC